MESWLPEISENALGRLEVHAVLVDMANVDEATFRAFFVAEIRRCMPEAKCQTEWHRYDLLVQQDSRNTLIEFKFYITRPSFGSDGERTGWKGGPGGKNEQEFWKCVQKLRESDFNPIHSKCLVLVYERQSPRSDDKTYHRSYSGLAPDDDVVSVWRTCTTSFCCVVLAIA